MLLSAFAKRTNLTKINFPCNSLSSDRMPFHIVQVYCSFSGSSVQNWNRLRLDLLLFSREAHYLYNMVLGMVCCTQGVMNLGVAAFRIGNEGHSL